MVIRCDIRDDIHILCDGFPQGGFRHVSVDGRTKECLFGITPEYDYPFLFGKDLHATAGVVQDVEIPAHDESLGRYCRPASSSLPPNRVRR